MKWQTPRACAVFICLIFALPLSVFAQAVSSDRPPVLASIELVDGTTLRGRVVEESSERVVLEHATLGRLEIARDRIARVVYETGETPNPRDSWKIDPSYNSIVLTPTPATLPKGTGYFRDFELLFLNLGYAPSDQVNLAIGTVFPVTSSLVGFIAGAKVRLLDREQYGVGVALNGSFTFFEDLENDSLSSLGVVLGVGDRRQSLNVSFSGAFVGDEGEGILLIGGDMQVRSGLKLIAEYGNVTSSLFEDEDFNGLINFGVRFFGDNIAFTLTGFRPLEETGSLLLFPLGVFSVNW